MKRSLFALATLLTLPAVLASFGEFQAPKSYAFEDSQDEDFDNWGEEGIVPGPVEIEKDGRTPFEPSFSKVQNSFYPLHREKEIAQATNEASKPTAQAAAPAQESNKNDLSPILINFNNVSIIEFIRFVSRLTNKNFIFDEEDLQFTVTIISEEATTLDNIMTALLQELRIHDLTMIEQGNNIIIHKTGDVNSISKVKINGDSKEEIEGSIVTQVFTLNTLDPEKAAAIVKPLTSKQALVEVSPETQHIVVTDLVSNVDQIAILLKGLDSPTSGLIIGQYAVKSTPQDVLIKLSEDIMTPIAKGQPLTFVAHPNASSIFIVSTPYLVERAISVMQKLDQLQAKTQIIDLQKLKKEKTPEELEKEAQEKELQERPGFQGQWETDETGKRIFKPTFKEEEKVSKTEFPKGEWILDPQGNWYFVPEGSEAPFKKEGVARPELPTPILPGEKPKGTWSLDPRGGWVFQLSAGEPIKPEILKRSAKVSGELPLGSIQKTQFYVHKLQYLKGDQMLVAIENISASLSSYQDTNQDLIEALNSVQWIESTNTLVITGFPDAIAKAKELIDELDVPVKQVFIEMLILETDLDDSLTYGVEFITRSGGGNTATAQAFLGSASTLPGGTDSSGIGRIPNANSLARAIGYHLGVIGQRLTHGGTQYATLAALISAEHARGQSKIVFSPKLLTEDNVPAEIFVGINTPYQTDSIVNDQGSIVTNNFEYRDIGTRMRVTPHISNNNELITLEIEQEVSRDAGTGGFQGGNNIQPTPTGPTTSINRTSTTVHIPNGYFLVMSGMLQEEKIENRNYLPCLGGVPIIGALCSTKNNTDQKRNIMIFIRPEIVETKEQIDDLTKRQQDIYDESNKRKKTWKYEVDEALDFLNIRRNCCEDCNY